LMQTKSGLEQRVVHDVEAGATAKSAGAAPFLARCHMLA
jgi:hypothetical protein